MARGIEAGSSFLAGVLSKLPEADRQKGQEALETLKGLGGGTVVAAIGDGTLAQAELSRQLDTLATQKEELDATRATLDQRDQQLTQYHTDLSGWYEANKDLLKKAKVNPQPNPDSTPKPVVAGLTEEQLNTRIQAEQAGFLGFQNAVNQIQRDHFTKFGEIADLEPLLKHPEVGKVGLHGVYALVYKDRLEKHTADTQKAAEDKIRADERQKLLAEQAQLPYNLPTGAGSGSPLDALQNGGKPDSLADQAGQHYARLQAERAAGTRA